MNLHEFLMMFMNGKKMNNLNKKYNACNNTNVSNNNFWTKKTNEKHTYILQYCGFGDNRGIRNFLDEYLNKYCLSIVACGRGGGGGVTFTTTVEIDELYRVLNTYNLEYVLYQLDTGVYAKRIDNEGHEILNKIFGNIKK